MTYKETLWSDFPKLERKEKEMQRVAILLFLLSLCFTLASMEIWPQLVGKYPSFAFVVSEWLYFTRMEDETL